MFYSIHEYYKLKDFLASKTRSFRLFRPLALIQLLKAVWQMSRPGVNTVSLGLIPVSKNIHWLFQEPSLSRGPA